VAAIAYKNGITQSELAEWFDVERKTIYNWLTRLEERNVDEAIRDEQRAGRPRKLAEEQLGDLRKILQNPPTEAGLHAPAWTTELLQQFIRDEFETHYSRPSCRRLMKEVGLSYQTSRKAAAEGDSEEREAFEQELKKLGHVWMPS
jgi:transposase